jgi:hypothetical protein
MSKGSQNVINWRKRTKKKIIEAMGGGCQICSYNKCPEALELHHINPAEKEFSFGSIRSSPKKLEVIKEEIKKCILLCSNCHREVHAGLTNIPENYTKYDESYLVSEIELKKRMIQQTSIVKQPIDKRKIFLTDEQLYDMLNTQFNGNKSALARSLKVSETAIRKRLKDNLYHGNH